ncbi:hypothetical protein ACFLYF_00175 [Chloroflexota bacterium]
MMPRYGSQALAGPVDTLAGFVTDRRTLWRLFLPARVVPGYRLTVYPGLTLDSPVAPDKPQVMPEFVVYQPFLDSFPLTPPSFLDGVCQIIPTLSGGF